MTTAIKPPVVPPVDDDKPADDKPVPTKWEPAKVATAVQSMLDEWGSFKLKNPTFFGEIIPIPNDDDKEKGKKKDTSFVGAFTEMFKDL